MSGLAIFMWRYTRIVARRLMSAGSRIAIVVIAVGVMTGAQGCGLFGGGDSEPPVIVENHPERDPDAKLVTISSTLLADPRIVELSVSNSESVQWLNNSEWEVTITFVGGAAGFTLPPGVYSYVHKVNPAASPQGYSYLVQSPEYTPPEGTEEDPAPDPPQVDVGS